MTTATKPMSLAEVKLAAMQRAYNLGHADVALMILSGKARVYRRTPTEKPGWQVSDYTDPYPKGTLIVVLADCYATGSPEAWYVVPVADLLVILREQFEQSVPSGVRPRNPDSLHSAFKPELVAKYRDAWKVG
jgi:hypothetical protein